MAALLDRALRWEMTIAGEGAIQMAAPSLREGAELPVIVFDGDDTLWATEHLYDEARRLAGQEVEAAGLGYDDWWHLQVEIDLANVKRFGLSAERFPTSCVEAFTELARNRGMAISDAEIKAVWKAAESVFEAVAPVSPAAEGVLVELHDRFRLILLTQGDPRVQRKRVEDSGLLPRFDEVVIVAKKSPAVLGAVIDHFSIPHEVSWMVGNSLASDVNPALAAGMRAIWIDAHVWGHERREQLPDDPSRVTVAEDLSQVPQIVRGLKQ